MKRRSFISAGALTVGILSFPKLKLFANQPQTTHYVGIGRGACNILDYVLEENPNVKIIKALGINTDYAESAKQKRIIIKGEAIEPTLNEILNNEYPLVIFYCLGGNSNAQETISFIKKLKQQERVFKLIIQFPFSFEGKRRIQRAITVADQLAKLTSLKCIHGEQIRKNLKKTTLGEAFKEANLQMYQLTKTN